MILSQIPEKGELRLTYLLISVSCNFLINCKSSRSVSVKSFSSTKRLMSSFSTFPANALLNSLASPITASTVKRGKLFLLKLKTTPNRRKTSTSFFSGSAFFSTRCVAVGKSTGLEIIAGMATRLIEASSTRKKGFPSL